MNYREADRKKLSELRNGEKAVILNVRGKGAFLNRLSEMGFVSGTEVMAIKKAPLQDPVEYELMGYRISLRNSEAYMIEVIAGNSFLYNSGQRLSGSEMVYNETNDIHATISREKIEPRSDEIRHIADSGRIIKVALVGNPNCGKTTLFNHLTGKQEKVGNYGGVTVDIKTARFQWNGYDIHISDLPGTYSLDGYSPEEKYVKRFLGEKNFDIVINVVDASNIERNLFLTTELLDLNLKCVIALNMYDELKKSGDRLRYRHLSKILHSPAIPVIASKGKGIGTVMDAVTSLFEGNGEFYQYSHLHHGHNSGFGHHHRTEGAGRRYSYIRKILRETYMPSQQGGERKGYRADKILTHKWLGIPVFLFFMWIIFFTTFSLGNYPMEWIESGVEFLGSYIGSNLPEGVFRDLIIDGVIGGVGGVIVFLPNIVILFLAISLLEDTGYMARAAFIMDRIMRKIGLHGKSFIPLLMGFGCNVPAILATRTLENRKDRLLTILIIPFMSCSARLPVYILLISAFFVKWQSLILLSVYIIGIITAALTAVIFNKVLFKKRNIPFVMELPPYRMPTLRNIYLHTWHKSVHYLSKMGSVILVASVLIWALGYFPRQKSPDRGMPADPEQQIENSYIGQIGHLIQPLLLPLGYDWKIGVSILTGMAAKEIIVSSMGVLYQSRENGGEVSTAALNTKLQEQKFTSGKRAGQNVFSPLTAYSLMIFILFYFPCVAVLAAVNKEAGFKWAVFVMIYSTSLAWIAAFIINQAGGLIFR